MANEMGAATRPLLNGVQLRHEKTMLVDREDRPQVCINKSIQAILDVLSANLVSSTRAVNPSLRPSRKAVVG